LNKGQLPDDIEAFKGDRKAPPKPQNPPRLEKTTYVDGSGTTRAKVVCYGENNPAWDVEGYQFRYRICNHSDLDPQIFPYIILPGTCTEWKYPDQVKNPQKTISSLPVGEDLQLEVEYSAIDWENTEWSGLPGDSPYSDTGEVSLYVDLTPPAKPTNVTANAKQRRIEINWDEVTTNKDGSEATDVNKYAVYYDTTSGIDVNDDSTYSDVEYRKTNTWSHEVIATGTRYYRVTAIDNSKNESLPSTEVSATAEKTDVDPEVTDYTQNISDIQVGDKMIGVVFKEPSSGWIGFDRYKLYYAVDTGGGFGSWQNLFEGQNPAYIHKNLNSSYDYKYKLSFVDVDGNETTGTIQDNSGAGYTPNNSDNSNLTDFLLVENLTAEDEIRGNEVYAESKIVLGGIDDSGYIKSSNYSAGSAGFQINSAGDAEFNNVTVRGQVEISSGSGISNLTDAGDLATKDAALVSNGDVVIDGSLSITGDVQSDNWDGSQGWKIDGSTNKMYAADFEQLTSTNGDEIIGGGDLKLGGFRVLETYSDSGATGPFDLSWSSITEYDQYILFVSIDDVDNQEGFVWVQFNNNEYGDGNNYYHEQNLTGGEGNHDGFLMRIWESKPVLWQFRMEIWNLENGSGSKENFGVNWSSSNRGDTSWGQGYTDFDGPLTDMRITYRDDVNAGNRPDATGRAVLVGRDIPGI